MTEDDRDDDNDRIPTSIVSDARHVRWRVKELGLDLDKLVQVVALAIAERTNATSHHCANAAYHYGTFGLRDKFVSGKWAVDRADGIESIRNDDLKIKIAFCNVDVACDRFAIPKPRSEKGAGLERAASGNLFVDLPQLAKKPKDGWALYYLMLAEDGRGELSRPIVQNGTFTGFVERIFLGHPDDGAPAGIEDEGDGPSDSYDPIVIPKTRT